MKNIFIGFMFSVSGSALAFNCVSYTMKDNSKKLPWGSIEKMITSFKKAPGVKELRNTQYVDATIIPSVEITFKCPKSFLVTDHYTYTLAYNLTLAGVVGDLNYRVCLYSGYPAYENTACLNKVR